MTSKSPTPEHPFTLYLSKYFWLVWLYVNKVIVLPCLWPTSARGFYEQSWCIPEVASRLPRPLERELIHRIWKFWPTGTESKPNQTNTEKTISSHWFENHYMILRGRMPKNKRTLPKVNHLAWRLIDSKEPRKRMGGKSNLSAKDATATPKVMFILA